GSLEIWLGTSLVGDAEILAAFAGGVARTYPDLSELRIIDIPGCSNETIAEANRVAGRPVARAVIPLPRLYPIAADFHLLNFAGHLPDGTQGFAEAPYGGGTTARLFCFTPAGEQTEIREVTLPAECGHQPQDKHSWEHTARVKEFLGREMGFTPGLIRIRDIDDPPDGYGVGPYSNYAEDYVGCPDDPAVRPEEDGDLAEGCATVTAYWLKYGAYIFYIFWSDNDWHVGPDGKIEST